MTIQGKSSYSSCEHTIIPDRIEAGTFIAAALATSGEVTIKNINPKHMDAVWVRLDEMGAKYTLSKTSVTISGTQNLKSISKLDTRTYPGFPTDLQQPFAVPLLTAQGSSRIFETMFEGRFDYLYELQNMKAKVEVLNPHQAVIQGSASLVGASVSSCDLRAGGTLVLAALIAK